MTTNETANHERSQAPPRKGWLEVSLVFAVLLLLLQVFGHDIRIWWHLPRPGVTGIDYFPGKSGVAGSAGCISAAYVCSLPATYSDEHPWPLIIYLHGSGERGAAPEPLLPLGRRLAKLSDSWLSGVVIMPQCLPGHWWVADDIDEFIRNVQNRYSIDGDRVYLVGYSMGATGAWSTVAKYPNRFAALIAIAGGGGTASGKELATVPSWAFHGELDEIVAAAGTIETVDAIRQAGGQPKITIYPGKGHGICTLVLEQSKLWDWLAGQTKRSLPQTTRELKTGHQ